MQVHARISYQHGGSVNQYAPVIRICFNDLSSEDSFNHIIACKTLFQRVLHGMAFDQVMPVLNPFLQFFYVQDYPSAVCTHNVAISASGAINHTKSCISSR